MTETREVAIELREDESRQSPGILTGRLLTYGERIVHAKGPETFEPRALEWGSDGVTLYDTHDGSLGDVPRRPVAIVHPVQSDTEARIEEPLPDTPAGRRVADAIRGGALKGLSIEFRAQAERHADGVRRIVRALLTGLAVVASPAYPSASVEVRGKRRFWMPLIPRT